MSPFGKYRGLYVTLFWKATLFPCLLLFLFGKADLVGYGGKEGFWREGEGGTEDFTLGVLPLNRLQELLQALNRELLT